MRKRRHFTHSLLRDVQKRKNSELVRFTKQGNVGWEEMLLKQDFSALLQIVEMIQAQGDSGMQTLEREIEAQENDVHGHNLENGVAFV